MRYAVVDVEGNGQQPPDLVDVAVVPVARGIIGPVASWLVSLSSGQPYRRSHPRPDERGPSGSPGLC